MNFRYKLNSPRPTTIIKTEGAAGNGSSGLPEIRMTTQGEKHWPTGLQLKNSFIISRLKETPTFHLLRPQNTQRSSVKLNKITKNSNFSTKNETISPKTLLDFCNKDRLDHEIIKAHTPTNSFPHRESMNKRLQNVERNMLYFGKERLLNKNKRNGSKNTRKNKTQPSGIYERFFRRPNLNEMVNLSDLVRKKPAYDDFSQGWRWTKRPAAVP